MSESTLVRRSQSAPVEDWLEQVPERKASAVLQYAQAERSVVLSYLYASLMGMPASVDDWEVFCQKRWKKLDHRAILEGEIMALHADLAEIRNATEQGKIRLSEAPTKLSYLSRELRGHIEHLSKEVSTHDRRALILAGVEITAKMLRKVFGKSGSTWPAIEAAIESVVADIDSRHSM